MKHQNEGEKEKKSNLIHSILLVLGVFMVIGGAYMITIYYKEPVPGYIIITPENPFPNPHILLDTRNHTSYNASHIPEAILFTYNGCSSCFRNSVLKFDRSQTYILYGEYAINTAEYMANYDFKNLYVLKNYESLLEI